MKKIIVLSMALVVFSLWGFKTQPKMSKKLDQGPIDGKTLTIKKGCTLCHHPEKKIVGPSFKEISKIYKRDAKKILTFLSGQSKPIVHPEEFQYMKPVLNQLKHDVSQQEKEKIAKYIANL